jgi:hypothetical protein
MSNPAIVPQPNGDVDIVVPEDKAEEIANGEADPKPEPSVDPDNLDHPEELMGE